MKKTLLISIIAAFAAACGGSSANHTANGGNAANAADAHTGAPAAAVSPQAPVSSSALTPTGSSLTVLKKDIGKTATEAKLWANKDLTARLSKIMGTDFQKMKKFWNVETPIEEDSGVYMMTGCETHNCGGNKYYIFVEPGADNINVYHFGPVVGKENVWAEKDDMTLPKKFAKELDDMRAGN